MSDFERASRESVRRLFEAAFGGQPAVTTSAPGRVNLIGEHVDYNGGHVLPLAIAQSTHVALRLRDDGPVRGASAQVDAGLPYAAGDGGSFLAHLTGAFEALAAGGFGTGSADIAIDSDVPIGSGLSSSAALLVATLRAVSQARGLELTAVTIAGLAHRAETEFVGVPVGTMDSMASSLGSVDSALFLDTESLSFERVAMPAGVEVVVVDSGIRHDHSTGGYRMRRTECERAAATLGVHRLCDLSKSEQDLSAVQGWGLLSPTLQQRVRHVVTENRRVLRAVQAMRNRDLRQLGQCLDESHASLRDWFEVSTPEVDALVEATRAAPGCIGARMTGGGFGGAIVALTHQGTAESVARNAVNAYVARVPNAKPRIVMPAGMEAT
jgi:galactokinase